MAENKPCCCKNNQKKSCCSKKENTCCNKTSLNQAEEIRKEVTNTYSQYAKEESQCSCKSKKYAISLGYTEEDILGENIPVGNLSCGNPVGLANIKEGETVMDLGCGKGFDCRLASKKVGPKGKVVGIDMTKEMIEKALEITKKEKYPNIEYELSRIEDLEKFDKFKSKFDLVISNCVFNLSPEKEKVIKGVYYVLKNGGRLIFTDPVALKPIPDEIRKDMKSYTSCMANASSIDELNNLLKNAGFKDIKIEVKDGDSYVRKWTPETKWENGNDPKEYITTASIFAYKK
jgi:SAM-dependent methyltransferase